MPLHGEVLDQESQRLHISAKSEGQPSHLQHFNATGRLVGWALRTHPFITLQSKSGR